MSDERDDVRPFRCPKCNKRLDAATSTTERGARPKRGDFSICIYCGTALRFMKDGTCRAATRADIDELDPDTAFALGRATAVVLEAIKERRRS